MCSCYSPASRRRALRVIATPVPRAAAPASSAASVALDPVVASGPVLPPVTSDSCSGALLPPCSAGLVGASVGAFDGASVGPSVGPSVGVDVGVDVGVEVGVEVGVDVGVEVGVDVGVEVTNLHPLFQIR